MLIVLLLIGVALVAFGALVLVKYSDRPGGTIKWLNFEVSSKGAGLPLVALGVLFIAFAAVRFPPPVLVQSIPPDPQPAPVTALQPGSSDSCMAAVLSGVPRGRVDTVEAGMNAVEIIGSHEKLDLPFVLILTDNGQRVGALRLRLYRASNGTSDLYKIEQAVDAKCANVEQMSNTSHGGNPRELQNWDTLREKLGTHEYNLRIGGEGNINVSNFTRLQ